MKQLNASLTGLIALAVVGGVAREIAGLRADVAALEARLGRQAASVKAPFIVSGPNNEPLFSVGLDRDGPLLFLGNPTGDHLVAAVTKTGSFLRLVGKNDVRLVDIRSDDSVGGRVVIHDAQGNAVAGMSVNPDKGGTIQVTPPGGGKSAVRLAGSKEGGTLAVYDESGKVRAQITTPGKSGNITLFGELGSLAMSSGEGRHPSLDISDAAGTILFVAQVTKNGVGAVEVGPTGNGVAASLTGGRAASALIGKKP